MNIAQLLDRAAQQFPDRPAIVADGRALTYRELRARVDRVAYALMERGVGGGDRIALLLPNIVEFAIVYLAAQKLGVVAVSLNIMLTSGELLINKNLRISGPGASSLAISGNSLSTVFHVASGLIHLLLVLAVISLILHFVLGTRTAV